MTTFQGSAKGDACARQVPEGSRLLCVVDDVPNDGIDLIAPAASVSDARECAPPASAGCCPPFTGRASQTTPISNTNSHAETKKMSLAESMNACWSTIRFIAS